MKFYLLFLFTLISILANSQNKRHKLNFDKKVYLGNEIHKPPIFKGGDRLLKRQIIKNFKFKKDFIFSNKTLFKISFIIEKSGRGTNYKFYQNTQNKEQHWMIDSALSMIKKLPPFNPAIKNGKKVRCWYCIEFANCYGKEIQFSNHLVYKCDATLDDICIDFNPCDSQVNFENNVFFDPEIMPNFNGGEDSLNDFIKHNLRYPTLALENNYNQKVNVTFIVEKDGTLANINILNPKIQDFGCYEEAIRIVKLFPKWKPGIVNGKPVRVQYVLPIIFKRE